MKEEMCLVSRTRMYCMLVLERQWGKRRDNVEETARCCDYQELDKQKYLRNSERRRNEMA